MVAFHVYYPTLTSWTAQKHSLTDATIISSYAFDYRQSHEMVAQQLRVSETVRATLGKLMGQNQSYIIVRYKGEKRNHDVKLLVTCIVSKKIFFHCAKLDPVLIMRNIFI